METEVTQTKM